MLQQRADERTLAALLDFSGRLAAAPTVEAVATVVVEDGCGAVGAGSAAVALRTGGRANLRVIARRAAPGVVFDPPAADREELEAMSRVVASGLPEYRGGHATRALLPLLAGEQAIGAAGFQFPGIPRLTQRQRALVMLVSRQAADALQRAMLFAAERDAREEAEAANRLKDEFLATLSHELRTPLNAIMGWAHMLLHGSLDAATTRRALEAILRNSHAQSQLVGDVLDVQRIVTGGLRLHVRPVDVRSIARLAVEAVQPAADARGMKLEMTTATDETTLAADGDRLQQVIWNLLSNAVKFGTEGGRVDLSIRRTGAILEVAVSDDGVGIAPEFLPRVFERFSQADTSSRRAHGGLGLGLAIVRHLVELHGGSVEASSEGPGRGATFTVRLPARVPAPRAEPEAQPAAAPSARPRPGPVDLRGLRVLVVDDEADARELVVEVLRQRGAQAFTAASVGEALDRLAQTLPHVLIADIGMPGEDGFELIRRVRALPFPAGHTPAMALTAYGRPEDRARCLLLGYQVHVTKPVIPDELVAAIGRLRDEVVGF